MGEKKERETKVAGRRVLNSKDVSVSQPSFTSYSISPRSRAEAVISVQSLSRPRIAVRVKNRMFEVLEDMEEMIGNRLKRCLDEKGEPEAKTAKKESSVSRSKLKDSDMRRYSCLPTHCSYVIVF